MAEAVVPTVLKTSYCGSRTLEQFRIDISDFACLQSVDNLDDLYAKTCASF